MGATAKLTADSLLTADDQERLYREQMGAERLERQVRARRLEQGKCVCTPRKVAKRWAGDDAKRTRVVHDRECPRFAAWMAD